MLWLASLHPPSSFSHCRVERKKAESRRVERHSEIVPDNLSNAGWSWGCVVSVNSEGRDIFVVGLSPRRKLFVVDADEKLTAFVGRESAIQGISEYVDRG
jgi:hypothetical protein